MKKILLSTILVLGLFSVSAPALFAQGSQTSTGGGGSQTTTGGGGSQTTTGSDNQNISITLENPFKAQVGNNLFDLMKAILENIIMPLGGILCVLAFIYAGFMYVTAQGDTKKIADAHRMLLYAAIGTAILIGAEAIALAVRATIEALKP